MKILVSNELYFAAMRAVKGLNSEVTDNICLPVGYFEIQRGPKDTTENMTKVFFELRDASIKLKKGNT